MPKRTDLQSLLVIGMGSIAFTISSCAQPSKNDPLANLQPTPPDLLAVEKECGLRSPMFRYTSSGSVLLMPDPNEKYEAVDCALASLKRPELSKYVSKLGFVGNEMHPREEQK